MGSDIPIPTKTFCAAIGKKAGELITVGSDAHAPEHLAFDFSKVGSILQNAGFRYYTIFRNRNPIMLPFA